MEVVFIREQDEWEGDLAELDFTDYDFDDVIYFYCADSYEGSGHALLRKGNKWWHESLSHCSCYGPFEDFRSDGYPVESGETYHTLLERCTPDLLEELRPIIAHIEENSGKYGIIPSNTAEKQRKEV